MSAMFFIKRLQTFFHVFLRFKRFFKFLSDRLLHLCQTWLILPLQKCFGRGAIASMESASMTPNAATAKDAVVDSATI